MPSRVVGGCLQETESEHLTPQKRTPVSFIINRQPHPVHILCGGQRLAETHAPLSVCRKPYIHCRKTFRTREVRFEGYALLYCTHANILRRDLLTASDVSRVKSSNVCAVRPAASFNMCKLIFLQQLCYGCKSDDALRAIVGGINVWKNCVACSRYISEVSRGRWPTCRPTPIARKPRRFTRWRREGCFASCRSSRSNHLAYQPSPTTACSNNHFALRAKGTNK